MDTTIIMFVHEHLGPQWLPFFTAFTLLGRGPFLLPIAVAVSVGLMLFGRFNKAHMAMVAIVTAALTSSTIKAIVARPRPELFERMDWAKDFSFPSGHALICMTFYGLLTYFLTERFPRWKALIWTIFGIVMFIIGLSRLYLGVHWPSDILGGWLIGGALLALMIWWYKCGGIYRTIRIVIGIAIFALGLVGLVVPIIPGIPLIIAAAILMFSKTTFTDIFNRAKKPPLGPKDIEIPNE